MSLVVGVDVGIGGAIAFLDLTGTLMSVEDMPVDEVQVGRHVRSRVSDIRLLGMLEGGPGGYAFIERPEGRPMPGRDKATGQIIMRQPGAAGMLAFGESFGIVRCACVAKGFAITETRPGEWKRSMGVPADKDQARRRAAELFPAFAKAFVRKKDDGRAEACLIGWWGARSLRGRAT